ncbi:glycosyltransferase family 1 protein, partial [bacterium]|nr:glycosyltransferase family 1 protein [bacterium]
MIKVLIVVSSLNQGSGVMGVVMNYYRNLDREKICYDFLCFSKAETSYKKEIEEMGGKVYFFTKPTLNGLLTAKKDLKNFFCEKGKDYSIIHIHEVLVVNILYPHIKKCTNAKIIAHAHSTKFSDTVVKSLRNKMLCLGAAKKVDYCFACSEEAGKTFFGKKIVNNKKFRVITNAIDLKKYVFEENVRENYRKDLRIDNDAIVIGHVGRFSEEKNHLFLIELIEQLNKLSSRYKLLLVGDGALKKNIESTVSEKKLSESVIFTGNRKDVPKILNSMDIFVLPSLFEGVPVVAIEAFANGLPCILSDRITKALKINDNVKYLSIDNGVNTWIELIESGTLQRRDNTDSLNINYNI